MAQARPSTSIPPVETQTAGLCRGVFNRVRQFFLKSAQSEAEIIERVSRNRSKSAEQQPKRVSRTTKTSNPDRLQFMKELIKRENDKKIIRQVLSVKIEDCADRISKTKLEKLNRLKINTNKPMNGARNLNIPPEEHTPSLCLDKPFTGRANKNQYQSIEIKRNIPQPMREYLIIPRATLKKPRPMQNSTREQEEAEKAQEREQREQEREQREQEKEQITKKRKLRVTESKQRAEARERERITKEKEQIAKENQQRAIERKKRAKEKAQNRRVIEILHPVSSIDYKRLPVGTVVDVFLRRLAEADEPEVTGRVQAILTRLRDKITQEGEPLRAGQRRPFVAEEDRGNSYPEPATVCLYNRNHDLEDSHNLGSVPPEAATGCSKSELKIGNRLRRRGVPVERMDCIPQVIESARPDPVSGPSTCRRLKVSVAMSLLSRRIREQGKQKRGSFEESKRMRAAELRLGASGEVAEGCVTEHESTAAEEDVLTGTYVSSNADGGTIEKENDECSESRSVQKCWSKKQCPLVITSGTKTRRLVRFTRKTSSKRTFVVYKVRTKPCKTVKITSGKGNLNNRINYDSGTKHNSKSVYTMPPQKEKLGSIANEVNWQNNTGQYIDNEQRVQQKRRHENRLKYSSESNGNSQFAIDSLKNKNDCYVNCTLDEPQPLDLSIHLRKPQPLVLGTYHKKPQPLDLRIHFRKQNVNGTTTENAVMYIGSGEGQVTLSKFNIRPSVKSNKRRYLNVKSIQKCGSCLNSDITTVAASTALLCGETARALPARNDKSLEEYKNTATPLFKHTIKRNPRYKLRKQPCKIAAVNIQRTRSLREAVNVDSLNENVALSVPEEKLTGENVLSHGIPHSICGVGRGFDTISQNSIKPSSSNNIEQESKSSEESNFDNFQRQLPKSHHRLSSSKEVTNFVEFINAPKRNPLHTSLLGADEECKSGLCTTRKVTPTKNARNLKQKETKPYVPRISKNLCYPEETNAQRPTGKLLNNLISNRTDKVDTTRKENAVQCHNPVSRGNSVRQDSRREKLVARRLLTKSTATGNSLLKKN